MFLNVSFPDRNFSVGVLLDDVWVHSVNSFLLLAEHPTRQLLVDFFIFCFLQSTVYICAHVIPTCGIQDGDTHRCSKRSCNLAVFNVSAWSIAMTTEKIIFWTACTTKKCRQGSAPFLCSQFGKEHFLFLLFIRKDFSQPSAQLTVTEMFLLFSNVTLKKIVWI